MAKLCGMCGSLCAYFLIFLGLSTVLSIQDSYFSYDVGSSHRRSEYSLDLELYDNSAEGRQFQKRDVENNQNNAPSVVSISTTEKPNGVTNSTGLVGDGAVSGNNKTLNEQKNPMSKTKMGKTTKASPPVPNVMAKSPLDVLHKNLGVNGTGQRKNISMIDHLLPNQSSIIVPLQQIPNITNPRQADDEEEDFDEGDLAISKFDVDDDTSAFNETLEKNNITIARTDNHLYYNSTLVSDPEVGHHYWVDLTNNSDAKISDQLSQAHRRAATVKLKFEFPFYGHPIKNVTIATGGFLYTGNYVHSWLAATQYIAPLMANFDTSISNDSFIRYMDNGTAFTVVWERVALQDKPQEGEFTFQTTLHKNGDIVFVYQNVPLIIKKIEDDQHPVKVGLSDAYIIDRTIFFVRRKTIYEYHRVNFFKDDIKNWTVIYLAASPTCLEKKDCVACITEKIPTFDCQWCPTINRCSTGVDRYRQDWLTKGCDRRQINNESLCSHISGSDIFNDNNMTFNHDMTEFQHQMHDFSKSSNRPYHNPSALGPNQPVKMGVSGIVAILFLLAMVAGLAVWVLYAYRNPHTTSGQILIRYRPSQWRWRRGEARYTAATIHM